MTGRAPLISLAVILFPLEMCAHHGVDMFLGGGGIHGRPERAPLEVRR